MTRWESSKMIQIIQEGQGVFFLLVDMRVECGQLEIFDSLFDFWGFEPDDRFSVRLTDEKKNY
jgi:hypothetical protein